VRRRTKKALKLTAHHAAIALQMLIHDGKIAAGDVAKALKRREKMIRELRRRLSALEDASRPAARKLAAASRKAARRAAPRARKAITRAQKTARQAQGRYMAAVRRLSKDARVKIKRIRKQSGVDAAVRAALKMAK
jgi:pyruvate/2-oxoglutarate dehydrogenase complex dihydrolipoamide acyltransferase (E2) component